MPRHSLGIKASRIGKPEAFRYVLRQSREDSSVPAEDSRVPAEESRVRAEDRTSDYFRTFDLVESYPRLRESVEPDDYSAQGQLF